MNLLSALRARFAPALARRVDNVNELLDMIRPAADPRFGDYQANFAMVLGKRLGAPPRDIAAAIVAETTLPECEPPEVAGPGFINLRVRNAWLAEHLLAMLRDERLGVAPTAAPRTFVVDYSGPNVAKPMHVGHIRSTVIGDALCRVLRFLGHRVIGDNHIGDWGTQFGMILYGYKHFRDDAEFQARPVLELARLYRLVNQLVEYPEARDELPKVDARWRAVHREIAEREAAPVETDKNARKKSEKELKRLRDKLVELRDERAALKKRIAAVESSPALRQLAAEHPRVGAAVLEETAKLHAGDAENRRLWHEFLPHCRDEIQRVYQRLGVRFDQELGESFYHDMLAEVVDDFFAKGLARVSDGAACVFLDGFEAPMIIRKKDGAYLYSTTDLATIEYRRRTWRPDAMLYVVDHRQSDHFAKLFAAARLWNSAQVELNHVRFGTVTDAEGKPYKSRSGATVGLESLLDDAVAAALKVVCANDDAKPEGPELSPEERQRVADVVGHAAIKYFDLMHNRASDYQFDVDKMVAFEGNTATYLQYSYARAQSVFAKGRIDLADVRAFAGPLALDHSLERDLALSLARLGEALDEVLVDYLPSQLTAYLFDLARAFAKFYNECPVLKAPTPELRQSRLALCDLSARAMKLGLELLGIEVVNKM